MAQVSYNKFLIYLFTYSIIFIIVLFFLSSYFLQSKSVERDIKKEIDAFKIEGDLRRDTQLNIKRLKDVKCYRGSRHLKHLPVRGQRTKTNNRTVRGNARRTMGSGRRKTEKT